jgi:hypothetical protein
MGIDTPLACLSDKPQLLFNYFKQTFAQVTNPAIDPIREDLVMSLNSYIGREGNILEETPKNCHTLKLRHPIISNWRLEKLRNVKWGDFLATTLPALFRVEGGEKELEKAVESFAARFAGDQVRLHAADSVRPRRGRRMRPIPSLLALSAVHNHLIREKTRNQVALIVESGRAARGDALRAAARLRRERGESLSRDRNARRSLPRRPFPADYTWDKVFKSYMKATTRACSRPSRRWASPRCKATRARRYSRPIGLNKLARGPLLHRHGFAHRRRGHRSAGARSADEASVRHAAAERIRNRAARRRRISIPRARRAPLLNPLPSASCSTPCGSRSFETSRNSRRS